MKVEGGTALPTPAQDARKAAKGFEAVFLKEMLKMAMPSATREQQVYGDCLADAVSREAADGRGMGLAEWMLKSGLKSGE